MVRLRVCAVLGLGLVAPAAPATAPAVGPRASARPAALAAPAAPARQKPLTLVVIANLDVPDSAASRARVRRIFLRRERFWHGGRPTAPVNLPATSPLRAAFSRRVLGSSPQALADYWNDLYFHGTQPPPVLESEAAVILYVARTPGGVGYVSADALQGSKQRASVKVLLSLALPPATSGES